jgi:HNH endonuclease
MTTQLQTKNREYYVKYLDNQPVLVETHYMGEEERKRPLEIVASLIVACTVETTRRLLGLPENYGPLTLHLPQSVARCSGSLAEDCFATAANNNNTTVEPTLENDNTTLDTGCLLSDLGGIGSKSKQPLIIKSRDVPKPLVPESVAVALFNMANETFVWNGLSTTSSIRERSKPALVEYYHGVRGNSRDIKCMLLNVKFNKAAVTNAHIFKFEWNAFREFGGLSDINDVRNFMLLFKPIEHAFDRSEICFILEPSTGYLVLNLLNRNKRDTTLYDAATLLNIPEDQMENLDRKLTFGDLAGKVLTSDTNHYPYKSLLNLQARSARLFAIRAKWIEASWNFADFMSEENDRGKKVELWLQKMEVTSN